MDGERRRRLAREVLDGYFSGPDAQLEATATALATIESARCVVLVERISDQIALDAITPRRGRDLGAEGIVIVPSAEPMPSSATSSGPARGEKVGP